MPARIPSDALGDGIPAPSAGAQPPAGACPAHSDDDLLAALLIRMWTLASGRSLPRDVPPDQLSAEELISFWADDMSPPAGRHVRPRQPDPTGADRSPRAPRNKDRRPSPARSDRGNRKRPADPAAI
jgi:hypothetical protein